MGSTEDPRSRQFNAQQMRSLLAELDEALPERQDGRKTHLVVAGGAAMMHTLEDRMSSDIDVISEGLTDELRAHAAAISDRHAGLRPDWLNDAAKLHRVDAPLEPQSIFEGRRLSVAAAGNRYLLAMKLVSGRPEDTRDCEHLIRELEIVGEGELLDLITASIPERLQTPRMAYFASERFRAAWQRRRWQRWRVSRRRRRG